MISRLLVIGVTGFVLTGYAPRWLSTGSGAWTIWVAAAAIVIGGPWALRRVTRSAVSRVRLLRVRAAKIVSGQP
jgi:hypothetical protein